MPGWLKQYTWQFQSSRFCEARDLWPTLIDILWYDHFTWPTMHDISMNTTDPSVTKIHVFRVNTCCWLWGHIESQRAGGQNAPRGIGRWESSAPPRTLPQTAPHTPQWRTGCSGWQRALSWPSSSGTLVKDLILAEKQSLQRLNALKHSLLVAYCTIVLYTNTQLSVHYVLYCSIQHPHNKSKN